MSPEPETRLTCANTIISKEYVRAARAPPIRFSVSLIRISETDSKVCPTNYKSAGIRRRILRYSHTQIEGGNSSLHDYRLAVLRISKRPCVPSSSIPRLLRIIPFCGPRVADSISLRMEGISFVGPGLIPRAHVPL